jgi:hypothetical protein
VSDELTIRRAIAADADSVADVFLRSFRPPVAGP